MPEKYQKLPKALHGKLHPHGRTRLIAGGELLAEPERLDAPAQEIVPDARTQGARGRKRPAAPSRTPDAPSAPSACFPARPPSWPDEWLASEAGPVHAPCGTLLRQATALTTPRRFCPTCPDTEFWWDGHRWKRVGTR